MITIRDIKPTDNPVLATIIRTTLEDFDLARPGTVYTDPTTDHLSDVFATKGSVYFVAEEDGVVLGGCGIFPTKGLPEGHAELVKLYLRKETRGKKLGFELMTRALDWAREYGYTHIYLETFSELSSAVGLYEGLGFHNLNGPMGESGHHACEIWMLKKLNEISTLAIDSQSPLYQKSLMIREEVFIKEQEIDPRVEIDEYESTSIYFLTLLDHHPVATGRLRESGDKIKFERIATLEKYRGRGFGKHLMDAMMRYAQAKFPDQKPFMHAQLSAADFYEKLGWTRVGEIFEEADIPHIAMTYKGKLK
ncbi:MAG: GNAT family N-acetyltransferase [Bdellovibrionota bacterium]